MNYATSAKTRVQPSPGASGICQCCGSALIAKCGTHKVWHWAHKSKQHCDHWWENETQWHRDWKNHFPQDWQEVVHVADDGEKHIADVKTPSGLVIEFQHSYIAPEEITARESFYQNMIWIVDGRRLKNDLKRFEKGFRSCNWNIFETRTEHDMNIDEYISRRWLSLKSKVFFDWGFVEFPGDYTEDGSIAPARETDLVCLEPRQDPNADDEWRYMFNVKRKRLLSAIIGQSSLPEMPVNIKRW